MPIPLQKFASVLRRAGLEEIASAALAELPDPVDAESADQFFAAKGLSAESLQDRMGGSP